jgi:hypothetical protein
MLVVLAYFFNFHGQAISKKNEDWAQFGDYLGGILNPIIALLNLIVLTYLTIKIVKIDDERNHFTLQELARPLGDIQTIRQEDGLIITLKNCGLGPLKVNKMSILYKGKEYNSYKEIFPKYNGVDSNLDWSYWHQLEGEPGILAKDSEVNLVKFSVSKSTASTLAYFKEVYRIMHETTVVIDYADIYNRQMPKITFDHSKITDRFFE